MSALLRVLVIAIGLAMDALSVSIIGGLKSKTIRLSDALKVALYFGIFQAGMPVIGWAFGLLLKNIFESYGNIIAFAILTVIGIKMVWEATHPDDAKENKMLANRVLLGLAVATSIDALMVGTTLTLLDVPLLVSIVIIGVVTFLLSGLGYLFGNKLGSIFGHRVEIFGGIVLIIIGITFLL